MLLTRFLDIELECGVDESGAGPAFGPVVAAAVILPKDWNHPIINDSKKLSEKKRDFLYEEIIKNALTYSIKEVDAETIDRINILQARFLAMKLAIESLNTQPKNILIDGNRFLKDFHIPYICVVKGDSKYVSIAAASILAKVHRDRLMSEWQGKYSNWNPEKHKGYLTKEHIQLINKFGISDKHRKTFLKNYL